MTETVFIIDNDHSVRRSLSRLMRSEGLASESFESASAYLQREKHDGVGCVVLDINMPEMDGTELSHYIRNQSSQPAVPVLMVTSRQERSRLAGIEQAGSHPDWVSL